MGNEYISMGDGGVVKDGIGDCNGTWKMVVLETVVWQQKMVVGKTAVMAKDGSVEDNRTRNGNGGWEGEIAALQKMEIVLQET